MAKLKRTMHPKLNSAGCDAEYIDKMSEWQQVVREYEQTSGKEMDQTKKTATLTEEEPPQMQEHLRLRSEEINWHRLQEGDTSYRGLRALEENVGF